MSKTNTEKMAPETQTPEMANGMKLEEAMTKWQSMDQLPAEYRS